ncbi:REP-associated tyrosine transposase [Pseudoalteromonas rhizosphaerae]|uniref:REP-associated tyrosine transposase n=1 Tax=Pseudoalteromonas rhizosphaerae TaxID=2518973 RepID=UPI001230752F|nr:transposase [Pseudoalteromonas rhizosphaerae]
MVDTSKRTKGRCSIINHYYSVTICTENRMQLFCDFDSSCLIMRELHYFSHSGNLKTICFSLMPDHLHWLFQLRDTDDLSKVIGQFKSITTIKLNRYLLSSGKIWQANFYDHKLRSDEDLLNQARYIVANPLRAGLVKSVGDYPFWNCVYLN